MEDSESTSAHVPVLEGRDACLFLVFPSGFHPKDFFGNACTVAEAPTASHILFVCLFSHCLNDHLSPSLGDVNRISSLLYSRWERWNDKAQRETEQKMQG